MDDHERMANALRRLPGHRAAVTERLPDQWVGSVCREDGAEIVAVASPTEDACLAATAEAAEALAGATYGAGVRLAAAVADLARAARSALAPPLRRLGRSVGRPR